MDYNPNGQFNNENFYIQNLYTPLYYPVMKNPEDEERNKNKKILKALGVSFGVAIIIYSLLSEGLVALLLLLAKIVPLVKTMLSDSTCMFGLSGILSEVVIGISFFISYLSLKSKKYIGVLPFGTTYNKKAAAGLVMFFAPVVLITTILINLVSMMFQEAVGIEFESGFDDISAEGPLGAVILVLALSVLPAIIEEFCVRGVVLQPLRRYGDTFAIVMSAAIFSLLHGNMEQIPYTFPAGIVFGYICVATGSLWPSIILHFINNMFSTVQVIASSNFSESVSMVVTYVMLGILIVGGIAGGVIFFSMNYKTELKKGVKGLKLGEKLKSFLLNPAMIIAVIFIAVEVLLQINF